MQISDESERELSKLLLQQDFPHHETPFALGEVSYHQGWTFHHASANASPHSRRVLTIIYMDADMRVAEPVNDNQRNDLREWLPGAEVGGLAATHLNPILW